MLLRVLCYPLTPADGYRPEQPVHELIALIPFPKIVFFTLRGERFPSRDRLIDEKAGIGVLDQLRDALPRDLSSGLRPSPAPEIAPSAMSVADYC